MQMRVLAAAILCLASFAHASSPPFDSTWFRSDPSVKLSTTSSGTLLWESPVHFSTIFTYLPKPLTGDDISINMKWRSSGDNTCPASCYAHGDYCQSAACQQLHCVATSVNCLGGTGDFRIALLDTSHAKGKVTKDDWCPAGNGYGDMTKCITEEPFPEMRGYDFRIFPHLSEKASHEPGQVPCSIYRKSDSNVFGKSPRLGEWGCFGAPLGEWTTLNLSIKRREANRVEVSMTMNGVTREAYDTISESDPTAIRQVDAIAIGYPNGRHYTYVELGAAHLFANNSMTITV